MEDTKKNTQLSSVRNALQILKCFTMETPELRVSDIVNKLGLNKSSVSRTISTLVQEGFLAKNRETNKYKLGFTIITLSGVVYNSMDLYQESLPILKRLVEKCGETAHISVLDNNTIIYLQKVDCNHPVQFLTHIGRRNPPHCTSAGKVLLAYADPKVYEEYVSTKLESFTKYTITSPEKLKKHLEEIRQQGYAESYNELFEGVHSVASPIFNWKGEVVAAISVVGPKQRMDARKMNSIIQHMIRASKEVSELLGYRSNF